MYVCVCSAFFSWCVLGYSQAARLQLAQITCLVIRHHYMAPSQAPSSLFLQHTHTQHLEAL